jgi:hypothetical protein
MLKKKEWLRRFKQLLSKSELFDNFDIQGLMKIAPEGWNEELSPGEFADRVINFSELLICANEGGTGNFIDKEIIFMKCSIYTVKRFI